MTAVAVSDKNTLLPLSLGQLLQYFMLLCRMGLSVVPHPLTLGETM